MFGNSVRLVSTPVRGYVCYSCLARKNTPSPTQQQALRFVSAATVHSESGSAESGTFLCTIGKQSSNENGNHATPESIADQATKQEREPKRASKKNTKASKKPSVRKSYTRGPNRLSKPATKTPRLSKQKIYQDPEGSKTAKPTDRSPKENISEIKVQNAIDFVSTLKALRAKDTPNSEATREEPKKKKEGARRSLEADNLNAESLDLTPLDTHLPNVPKLSYGLDRVLFNPGVYHLQDPRSRVYNFDPYLGSIMPVSEFDFDALNEYITSSKDDSLHDLASRMEKKYVGSSSSMTSVLSHFHFLLSQWRDIDTSNVSQGFPSHFRTFTRLSRGPAAVFLRYNNGVYAVDADKEFDSATILMNLGKSMEKLLTLPTEDFERYRKTSENKISESEAQSEPEAYHYSTIGDFVMRSQLDAYDPRLPGTGMFDLKTRAVVSIRMNTRNPEHGLGYQIKSRFGGFESYEREYFDMIRAAFLKYSLQVRIGRMDGIFVAFHNIERIFGFQYISLPEMDKSIHGTDDTTVGDTEFKLSMSLWNKVLDKATERFPEQSLRFHFETREGVSPFMYIFAEPVTDEEIHDIQTKRAVEIEAAQKRILHPELAQEEEKTASPESTTSPDPEAGVKFGVKASKEFRSLEDALGGNNNSPGSKGKASETKTLDEDGNEEYDSEASTDSKFLDELSKPEEGKRKPLMGLILSIQNKVNGSPVPRPKELGPKDNWTVDYEITEFTSLARAWAVYEMCQKRRSDLAANVDGEDDARQANMFLTKLRELSAQGRAWREEQDEIDREYGKIVLNLESKDSSNVHPTQASKPHTAPTSQPNSDTSPPSSTSSPSNSPSSDLPSSQQSGTSSLSSRLFNIFS